MNRRFPEATEPNAVARLLAERRGSDADARRSLIDLTVTNPTAAGLFALDESARDALADKA